MELSHMQSNTTEWNTLLYTITALRDVEGAQVAYCPTGVILTPIITLWPRRPVCRTRWTTTLPRLYAQMRRDIKKKVGSGHFPGEILSVQKIEPRSVHGGKLEWKEDFPLLRCAIETIEEDIIEEEDNMHNNKQY